MKLRTLVVIVATLAVLSAIAFFVNRPVSAPPADARIGQSVVENADLEKAARIKISDSAKSTLLVRQADGTWSDASYFDLPADFKKLSSFTNDLQNAKIQRLISRQPEVIGRLEFKDTQIALLDIADKPLWSITLGKNFEGGGRFVRFGDENKAYLAAVSSWIDAEPKNWADSTLLSLKPEDVSKVEVSFDEGAPVVAQRAEKEEPFTAEAAPAGKRLAVEKIVSLLNSVGSLRFTDTSDLADANATAARAHQRTVRITTFAGKTYTVAMGRKPEQKIVKAPAPSADGKTGPAALGKVTDAKLAADHSSETSKSAESKKPASPSDQPAGPAAITEPATETIPAGPVYVSVTDSDAKDPLNAAMQKRAFQIYDYPFTSLPKAREELFEAIPPTPTPTPAPNSTPSPTAPNSPSNSTPQSASLPTATPAK